MTKIINIVCSAGGFIFYRQSFNLEGEMDKITFDEKRIAEGYLNRPWLHKKVIERFVSDCEVTSNFRNGLDVGCGAGLSTKALRLICDRVTGTDISEQMIQVCKEEYKDNKAYTFYRAKAEETKEPAEKYDIVTAAGMVNWVDRDLFLENMGHVLQDQGILLIYDFWITDKIQGNDAYTNWYHEEYLKRFPKPSRNENIWKQSELPDYFQIKNQVTYELSYDFSMEQFIDFMMIQSNVNTKIENGEVNEAEARDWFKNSLSPVFENRKKTLYFTGYSWYLYKSAAHRILDSGCC